MIEYLFYFTAILCGYSYFLYPLILILLPISFSEQVKVTNDNSLPRLSLIISVHNEAERIREKLINTLQLNYPKNQLEIIVASDSSTDATDSIVASYADKGVRLVRSDLHKGKEYAQLSAIRISEGEILIFSDVATKISKEALRLLVNNFTDNRVGAVSSEDQFISNDGKVVAEGIYLKYEMWLRRLESKQAGLVGLSGSFFAARRALCEQWDIYAPSDFNIALNCANKGMLAITSPDVTGFYKDLKDPAMEYHRKLRTVIRGITAIARHPEVLNPFNMGLFSFQIWSHKIMRWSVPWFLLAFAIATLFQQGQGTLYIMALASQLAFYALALLGWLSPWLRQNAVVKIVFFFVQTNLALAHATLLFLLGKRVTVWAPSQR